MQQTFPCPRCGSLNAIGQRSCRSCGERFQYGCAHCGATTGNMSKFCTNCGRELYQQTQLTEPFPNTEGKHYQEREGTKQKKAFPPSLVLLSFIAIALCIGAIIYVVGTDSQGAASKGNSYGFIFHETPAPTPPPDTKPEQEQEPEPEPEPAPDSPRYTVDEVITAARNFSPDCRKKRAG